MTKGRDIAAESIGDLLEVARLQRRNGMLRAECSQRGYLEEGEIYLQAGGPIYAQAGMLTGYEALHYLLSWRKIYFAFASEIPPPPANIVSAIRTQRVGAPVPAPATPVPAMHVPVAATPMPAIRVPTPQGPRWRPVEERPATITPQKSPSASEMAWLVPHKAGPEHRALSLPLSRRQRLLYVMIDGQRTVGDLARTTSRTAAEVELILRELQAQGLIMM